jgi:hypothetical protein
MGNMPMKMIDWGLMATLAVFQLYPGQMKMLSMFTAY